MSAGIAAHEIRLARRAMRAAVAHLNNAHAQSGCSPVDRSAVTALIDLCDGLMPATHILESRFRLHRVATRAVEVSS